MVETHFGQDFSNSQTMKDGSLKAKLNTSPKGNGNPSNENGSKSISQRSDSHHRFHFKDKTSPKRGFKEGPVPNLQTESVEMTFHSRKASSKHGTDAGHIQRYSLTSYRVHSSEKKRHQKSASKATGRTWEQEKMFAKSFNDEDLDVSLFQDVSIDGN